MISNFVAITSTPAALKNSAMTRLEVVHLSKNRWEQSYTWRKYRWETAGAGPKGVFREIYRLFGLLAVRDDVKTGECGETYPAAIKSNPVLGCMLRTELQLCLRLCRYRSCWDIIDCVSA